MIRSVLHISSLIVLLFVGPLSARGQASLSKDFGALNYDGGTLFLDARLGSNLFGSGTGGGSFSGIHSALSRTGFGTVFGNPALLSHVKRPQIGVETRLSIRSGSVGLGSTQNLPASFERKTDQLLNNLSLPEGVEPIYTNASFVSIGQPRQLSAFWMTWPVTEQVAVGFGYRQPLMFSVNGALSGFQTLLRGNKASNSNSIQIDLLANLSVRATTLIQVDELSLGVGGLLQKYWFGSVWWGASAYRFGASTNIGLDVLPQGVLTVSGTNRFYFNDAGDPNLDLQSGESNAFFWKIKGGFTGNAMGLRLGMSHQTFKKEFGTSLVLDLAPHIELWDGNASAEAFLPVFVDLEGVINNDLDDSQDLLDIEKLDIVRPNLSRRTHDAIGQWMSIHMPTSLTAGADFPLGNHTVVLNASRYWGSLSVEGEYGLEKGVIQRYKIGRKPTWEVKVGVDIARKERHLGTGSWNIPLRLITMDIDGVLFEIFQGWTSYKNPHYRFSSSLQWGKPVVMGLDNTFYRDLESLLDGMIPTSVSIGRSYTLFDRLDVGVHVVGVPDLVMRFSFGLDVN